jgi:hypothetical protein
MIELFIVTWFAVSVAEHPLVDGALDGVALEEQMFRSFQLGAL